MAKAKNSNGGFVLTKAQLTDITRAFKPVVKEDTVRLDVNPDGNLIFSIDDVDIVTRIIVPSTEIGIESPETYYFKLGVLKQILGVVKDRVTITVDKGMVQFLVDESEINMQVPIFDREVDFTYGEVITSESVVSESLSKLLDRLKVSRTTGAEATKTMYLGKNGIKIGSRQNIGICKANEDFIFSELDLNLIPEFFNYLVNATSFGAKLDFKYDGKYLVVEAENLLYKTQVVSHISFPDEAIEAVISDVVAKCRVPRQPLSESLTKLSIPLYGLKFEQQDVSLNINGDSLIALVKDLGGRVSKANISSVSHEGEASSYVNINHLGGAASVMNEDFDLSICDSVSFLEDENHMVVLFNTGD